LDSKGSKDTKDAGSVGAASSNSRKRRREASSRSAQEAPTPGESVKRFTALRHFCVLFFFSSACGSVLCTCAGTRINTKGLYPSKTPKPLKMPTDRLPRPASRHLSHHRDNPAVHASRPTKKLQIQVIVRLLFFFPFFVVFHLYFSAAPHPKKNSASSSSSSGSQKSSAGQVGRRKLNVSRKKRS